VYENAVFRNDYGDAREWYSKGAMWKVCVLLDKSEVQLDVSNVL